MTTKAEGGPEAVIPCEVCQASIQASKYVQHAQAHATLLIPDEYKPFTQKQGNENWLNNEGATGYLKPELNIKQRVKQKEHTITATHGYVNENCDSTVPHQILQIIIGYHDTFYIDILETGFIFDTLEQATGIGQQNKLQVLFNENTPIGIESTPFRHSVEWRNLKFVCNGCLTPIFKETLTTNKVIIEDKFCFSIVGTNYIFDCFAEDELAVNTFVDALRFFLKQNSSEGNKLAKLYLKDNLYCSIPKFNPRQKALMNLQQDLFVMTMTTTFRNLEEERVWCIDKEARDIFNAKSMYRMALREDVPWRQWGQWSRDKIVTYLKNNNKVIRNMNHCPLQTQTYDNRVDRVYPTQPHENFKTQNGDEDCLVM